MAKTKAAPEVPTEVTIPRNVLKQLISIPEDLERADLAYKNCQATVFRNFAQGLFRANNTRSAVAAAREALGEE